MLADDHHSCHTEHPLHLASGAAAHAGNQRVAPGEPGQLAPRLVRDPRVLRTVDDGCERAVDVEQDGGPRGVGREEARTGSSTMGDLGYERCVPNGSP